MGLVSVRIAEDDFCKRSASAGVVDYLTYDSANVAVSFGIVEGPEFSWCFVEAGVSGEDGTATE